MVSINVIEPAQTAWASPVVFAPMKKGSLRSAKDYRKLNAVTVRDLHHLQKVNKCVDALDEVQVFPNLESNSGYWKIWVDKTDRGRTAFTLSHGLY